MVVRIEAESPKYGVVKQDEIVLDFQYDDYYAPAYVGAGITGILFFLTLRRINLIDKDAEHEARREEDHHDDTL